MAQLPPWSTNSGFIEPVVPRPLTGPVRVNGEGSLTPAMPMRGSPWRGAAADRLATDPTVTTSAPSPGDATPESVSYT